MNLNFKTQSRNLKLILKKDDNLLQDERPTVGVTRWWAGRENAVLPEST